MRHRSLKNAMVEGAMVGFVASALGDLDLSGDEEDDGNDAGVGAREISCQHCNVLVLEPEVEGARYGFCPYCGERLRPEVHGSRVIRDE